MHKFEFSGRNNRVQIHNCQMDQATHKTQFYCFCYHRQVHRIRIQCKTCRKGLSYTACTPKTVQAMHQLCFLQTLREIQQLNVVLSDAMLFSFSLLIFGSDVSLLTFNMSAANQKLIKTSRRQVQTEISGELVFVHKLFKIYSLLRSKHKAVTMNTSLLTQNNHLQHLETTQ